MDRVLCKKKKYKDGMAAANTVFIMTLMSTEGGRKGCRGMQGS